MALSSSTPVPVVLDRGPSEPKRSNNGSQSLSHMYVCLAGYLAIHGIEDLRDHISKNARLLGFVALAPPHSKSTRPTVSLYEKGNQVDLSNTTLRKPTNYGPFWPIFYILDVLSIVLAAIRMKVRFDLMICVTYAPTIAGLVLKKLGYAKRVIYYSYDYVVHTEDAPLARRVLATSFRLIDAVCALQSDLTWNLNPHIGEARREFIFGKRAGSLNQITVRRPFRGNSRVRPSLRDNVALYIGYLRPNQGVELIIDSVPLILQHVPDFKLFVIGSGPEDAKLKRLANKTGVGHRVVFFGYVQSGARLDELLSLASIGLAMYSHSSTGLKWYMEPAKVRTYIQNYIPAITNVSPIMLDSLVPFTCAVLQVTSDKHALARTVIELLHDRRLLYEMQTSIRDLLVGYSADQVFEDAFSRSNRAAGPW